MARWVQMSAVMASIAWMAACDQQTEVQRQTHDLQQAQKDVGKVTQQLESDLAKARADVATLEQKLAMARQGLTDDVLENQKELQEALQAQEHNVKNEIGQAQREAEIHRRDTEAALQTLGQPGAPAPDQANTAAQPAPSAAPGDAVERDQVVPVRGGPDLPTEAPPAGSEIRNAPDTTTAPAPNPAPDTAPAPNPNSANGSTTSTTTSVTTTSPAAPTPAAPAPEPAPAAPEAPPAEPNAPH
jgi:hypothetical protein